MKDKRSQTLIREALNEQSKISTVASAYLSDGLNGLSPFDEVDEAGQPVRLSDMKVGKGDLTYADVFGDIIADSLGGNDPHVIANALHKVKKSMVLHSMQNREANENLYLADSLNGLSGNEIVPTLIIMEMVLNMNSSIPELVGILPMNREKTVMYAINMVVQQASGALKKGEVINTLNIGDKFAIKSRHKVFVYDSADSDGVKAEYKMKVYHRDDDAVDETATVGHNKTQVVFLRKDVRLNDFNQDVNVDACDPSTRIRDKKVTLDINYVGGELVVTVEDGALDDGDKFILQTSIEVTEQNIAANRGLLEPKITPHYYVAHPLTIGTTAFKFDIDTVRRNTGLSLMDLSHANNLPKAIEEIQSEHLELASDTAYIWHQRLDLTTTMVDSNTDIYDHLTAEVGAISNQIGIDTGFTSGVFLVGGSALDKALKLSKSTPKEPSLSGTKPIGYLGGLYHSYFNPSHDKKFPKVDYDGNVNLDITKNVYSQILVLGTSPKEEQKLVLGGFPDDGLRTESVPTDRNSAAYKAVEGVYVSQLNTVPETHYMAYILLVKGITND